MVSERGVLSYPIPLYQNVPIEPQFYKPRRFVIEDITLGQTTLVTTTTNHDYVIGQEVRLIIPAKFGCFQLNEVTGFVIVIPSDTQVILNIDSSVNIDLFSSTIVTTASPQILAIGDVNTGAINHFGRIRNKTYIPGSFRDISPR
jgi:hypothetical protein